MKINISKEEQEFKPIELKFTLETQEEVNDLYGILGSIVPSRFDSQSRNIGLATEFLHNTYDLLEKYVKK